ncbi:MAG: imidazoleglycerol-phosphate dehydratase HisB [Desulfovibrio sp.]|jgi:imidazoleglycerol-phosphate dehydratase|nr:imidazoleglycerol-phosphate dehydratase HisB [Desulfovibrio sp.]
MNRVSRVSILERNTAETRINLTLTLDGEGRTSIQTGIGLLNHLLTHIAFWGNMDLELSCKGDLEVDGHHSVEDVGLAFGRAFSDAVGDKKGIARVGNARVPMDEAFADVAVDVSGRPWLEWRNDDILPPVIGGEEKDLWREFFKSFVATARINLHVSFLYGKNGHHLLESVAKGFGLALKEAVRQQGTTIRSTKGGLD